MKHKIILLVPFQVKASQIRI